MVFSLLELILTIFHWLKLTAKDRITEAHRTADSPEKKDSKKEGRAKPSAAKKSIEVEQELIDEGEWLSCQQSSMMVGALSVGVGKLKQASHVRKFQTLNIAVVRSLETNSFWRSPKFH